MITNDLLQAKYEAQKRLDEAAEHDLTRYIENAHKIALETEKKYGITFKYGNIEGQHLESQGKTT